MGNLGEALVLPDVPVDLFLESQDQQVELLRELRLVGIGDQYHLTDREIPRRLAALISGILNGWADVRSATRRQAMEAKAGGRTHVNLVIPSRPGLGEALQRWLQLLEEADQLAAEGHLLMVATRDEVKELRRWYVAEITKLLQEN